MPDDSQSSNLSLPQQLVQHAGTDLQNRIDWHTKIARLRDDRLGRRRRRRGMYPGAPNFLEPIIDDNVRQVTSAENSILWSGSRYLALFFPLDQASMDKKRDAESVFDLMMRITLNKRSEIEVLLDEKNEIGMNIAKLTVNTDAMPGKVLPDFEQVDPVDLVVPTGTKRLRDAERLTHIIRLTEREFRAKGEAANWTNVEEVIKLTKEKRAEANKSGNNKIVAQLNEKGSDAALMGLNALPTSLPWIIVWEVYYYNEDNEKRMAVVSPFAKDLPISDIPWIHPPRTFGEDEKGEPLATIIPERRWPFVQFRFENRKKGYYDTRGLAELLADNQKTATAMLNAMGIQLDFFSHPILQGGAAGGNQMRIRPGARLPSDVTVAKLPDPSPIFQINADRERQKAARRAGAGIGSLTSNQSLSTPKTATESAQLGRAANMLSSDAVMRFTEPLGDLFNMMWQFLVHNPQDLIVVSRAQDQVSMFSKEDIVATNYIVVPYISGQNANPDFILLQLKAMAPFLQNSPVVRQAEFLRFLLDQIDPMITEQLVIDPNTQGGPGSDVPIVQQVEQLIQAVQALGQQQAKNTQFLESIAVSDVNDGQVQQPPAAAAPPANNGGP